MPKHCVIVESPTKAKTIKRFLGSSASVHASMGHIRDLPESKLGVDVEEGFEPQYVIPDEKKSVIKKLQEELDDCEELWIATDEDREGEAIGWHLTQVLKRKNKQPIRRIVFHEITEGAIKAAAENPRDINMQLVDAQQARRILDRLVGYTLSPFLWKKVYRGLSAGRVQSVAVRLIVDREREIQAFNAEEYWTVEVELVTENGEHFTALLKTRDGEKWIPRTADEANGAANNLRSSSPSVTSLDEKTITKTPPPPFTTSTLQQEASRKLGFSVKQTMVVAQQLYEGIDLGKGEGAVGLITYMRTDSVTLSEKALTESKEAIEKHFGREYILSEPRMYKTKSKGAQEAHEAIRPAELWRTPAMVKDVLDGPQLKLYTLIWNRTVATQMAAAQLKRVGADISAGKYGLRATGQTVLFDGYLRLYTEDRDDPEHKTVQEHTDAEDDSEKILPALKEGQNLKADSVDPQQHFTKPPPRYTEASLVKKLEEEGIGRPSTYAPTISTVQQRGYIRKDGKQLAPEDVAFTVTDLLAEHFPNIVDLAFTAHMENKLDDVADGEVDYRKFLKDFYGPFHTLVVEKTGEVKKEEVLGDREVGIDPASGKMIYVKTGRFGAYVQLGEMPKAEKGKKLKKEEKPRTASLPKGVTKEELTLEQALKLLSLPRMVGDLEGTPVEANVGRFGPYLRWGKVTVSVPPEVDLLTIEIPQVQQLIADAKAKREKAQTPLKVLGTDPAGAEVTVKDGRYGPYVTDGKTNASLTKKHTVEDITLAVALEMLEKKRNAPPSKRKWGNKKKKDA